MSRDTYWVEEWHECGGGMTGPCDTLEQVFRDDGEGGWWVRRVHAYQLAPDGHTLLPATEQQQKAVKEAWAAHLRRRAGSSGSMDSHLPSTAATAAREAAGTRP